MKLENDRYYGALLLRISTFGFFKPVHEVQRRDLVWILYHSLSDRYRVPVLPEPDRSKRGRQLLPDASLDISPDRRVVLFDTKDAIYRCPVRILRGKDY